MTTPTQRALYHLAIYRNRWAPAVQSDELIRLASTMPDDLLTQLGDAVNTWLALTLCDPAYDPQWYAEHGVSTPHPHLIAHWRGESHPAREAVESAAAACWAWLAAPVQLDLFAVSTHTQES